MLTPLAKLFQQGLYPAETYEGVSDTFLSFYRPNTPWGSDDGIRISGRGNGSERALVHFDLDGHIPHYAHIHSAKLSLFAWSRRTYYGLRISAFDVLRPWEGSEATWNAAYALESWGIPGCDQVGGDREGDSAASRFAYFTNYFYEWDITALVQRWVADPSTNNGVAFIGHQIDQEMRFHSSEWRVPLQRPKLEVVFTASGTPPVLPPTRTRTPTRTPTGTATPTSTPTLTPTPSPTVPPGGCLIESPHPYPNDFDQTWTITNPQVGATASRIHFSRLETEADFDYVIIKDGSDSVVQMIDGIFPAGLWSYSVPGRVVKVQLITDESWIEWGFCVDAIGAVG